MTFTKQLFDFNRKEVKMDYESVYDYLLGALVKQREKTDEWRDLALKARDVILSAIRDMTEHSYEAERWARDQAMK